MTEAQAEHAICYTMQALGHDAWAVREFLWHLSSYSPERYRMFLGLDPSSFVREFTAWNDERSERELSQRHTLESL